MLKEQQSRYQLLHVRMLRQELETILRQFHEKPELPDVITGHPNDLIDIVMGAWKCDGRRKGGIKAQELALAIQEKIGRSFDRNNFHLMIHDKLLSKGGYYRQVAKPDVLKAFLEVAFELWVEDGPKSYDPPIDLEKVIKNACKAIGNYDWTGRKSDLTALLSAIVEADAPASLEDIEWLVESRIHLRSPITPDLVSKTIAARLK